MSTKIKEISILGSGWLGFPLASHLLALGFEVKTSTRSLQRYNEIMGEGLQAFIVDIDNPQQHYAEFLQTDLLIINITSKKLSGFTQLITEIEQAGLKKVIFISSTSVYDNLNKVIGEDDQAELESSPSFQIEQMFLHNKSFLSSIVRFSGLIGYSRHPGHFFRSGKIIPQAQTPVNLIHRDDCLGIITGIIEQEVLGEVFNYCADTHPSKRYFYSHARKLLNLPPPEFTSNADLSYKIMSNDKIKRMLNYKFKYPDVMKIPYD